MITVWQLNCKDPHLDFHLVSSTRKLCTDFEWKWERATSTYFIDLKRDMDYGVVADPVTVPLLFLCYSFAVYMHGPKWILVPFSAILSRNCTQHILNYAYIN